MSSSNDVQLSGMEFDALRKIMYDGERCRANGAPARMMTKILDMYMKEVRRERILKGQISLLGLMQEELHLLGGLPSRGSQTVSESHQLLELPDKAHRHLCTLLRPFFDKYDTDSNGKLDQQELWSVFHDLNEPLTSQEINDHFASFDKDGSSFIDFNEFVDGVAHFVAKKTPNGGRRESSPPSRPEVVENEDMYEEHEEMPEDLRDLSPEMQQRAVKRRALLSMACGTALVLIFSDPIVDVMSAVGDRTGVSSFYISFLLAPLASNASELIAAFKYSLKKTSRTITVSFAALQGAACMNNTFCLGVFMILIYFEDLAWEFNAETVSILAVEIVMALVSLKDTYRVIDSLGVLCLYPLSLVLVASLEAIGWD